MATTLAIDQELLDRAFQLSGEPTREATVTLALREFVVRQERRRIVELFGTLEWDSSFDHRPERTRSR